MKEKIESSINRIIIGFNHIKSGLKLIYADKITNPVIDDLKIYLKGRLKEELAKTDKKVFEKIDKVLLK